MILLRIYSCLAPSSSKCCSLSPQCLYIFSSRNIFTANNVLYVQNYYEILGVKSNCSQKEIRSAYLELCKRYHPDMLKADENKGRVDNGRFQRINEAYNCLSKVSDRSRYDLSLRGHDHSSWAHQTSSRQHYYYAPPRRHPRYEQNFYHMHYGYRAPDRGKSDFKLFGTSFVAFIACSLIVILILQVFRLTAYKVILWDINVITLFML